MCYTGRLHASGQSPVDREGQPSHWVVDSSQMGEGILKNERHKLFKVKARFFSDALDIARCVGVSQSSQHFTISFLKVHQNIAKSIL